MKIIATLIVMLAASPVYAELYKCKVKGKTTYQEKPCQGAGSEFILRKDISPEQQQAAQEKLEAELAARAEKQRLQQEDAEKEKSSRLDGTRANATPPNSQQQVREQRNNTNMTNPSPRLY